MRPRTPTAVLLTAAMVAASAPALTGSVAAVDVIDDELAYGTFTGTVAVDGGFTLALGDGVVRFTVDVGGPAEITVPETGDISGSWDYTGTGSSDGTMAAGGFSVPISTTSSYVGSGGFAGSRTTPRIVGSNTGTSTGTFMGISQTTTETQTIDFPFRNVLAGCGQIVASFDQQINADIDGLPGGTGMFRGIVAVYDELPDESIANVESMVERVATVIGTEQPTIVVLVDALELLDEVEQLQAELLRDDCPLEDHFFNLLTEAARDLLDRAFRELAAAQATNPDDAGLTAAALPGLIRLGLGTGAMGSGSGGRGAELDAAARTVAHDAFSVLLGAENFDTASITRLATLSYQMGWDLEGPNGLSDYDIAITLGADL